jgi:type 1 glutamine amidotransferase
MLLLKKYWFVTLALVCLLSVALITIASVVQGFSTPPRVCRGQQGGAGSNVSTTKNTCQKRILVFSKTAGFRHASIKDGKIALQQLATEHHFAIDFTEDSAAFTDANLAHYDAVVFLLTTGEIFDGNQRAAFIRYIRAGGGYVGIHSASDTEYDWPWYGNLLGAFINVLDRHSKVTQATIHVVDRTHPSTSMLPPLWVRTDEWYNFATNPRGKVQVLLTIDENTYIGGDMGYDHPIAWYHDFEGGRSWYTSLGHTSASYYEPLFLAHLWGGITYAAGPQQQQTSISPRPAHILLQQAILIENVADITSVTNVTSVTSVTNVTMIKRLVLNHF